MGEIIETLQEIQDDLVGIVLPVLMTSFVSCISIVINAVIQIRLRHSDINGEQYKLMQKIYPMLKMNLQELKLRMKGIQDNKIYRSLNDATNKYIEYKRDDAAYIKKYMDEEQNIHEFIAAMDKYVDIVVKIKGNLYDETIPRVPVMHFLLKRRVSKMLGVFGCYSLLWSQYKESIDINIFLEEINAFEKRWHVKLNVKSIEKYIRLLDEWLVKY